MNLDSTSHVCATCGVPLNGRRNHGKLYQYCSRMCLSRPAGARFREGFIQSGPDDCWVWIKSINGRGYGSLSVDGRVKPAHRYSWEFHRGPIPEGMWVLHHCDNRPCVNPDHLFLGTHQDNMDDMMRKGRRADLTGRRSKRAKFTDEQVHVIRTLWAQTRVSPSVIARLIGEHRSTIRNIINRSTYKYLP